MYVNIYRFKNLTLELSDAKGTLFSDGKLVFKGFGYTAIQEYIRASGDNPKAKKPFLAQLETREKCRFKKIDDEKAHHRQLNRTK